MTAMRPALRTLAALVATAGLLSGSSAIAQVTPAAGYTPPDDTPAIKLGTTIYTDYTYTDEPTTQDADGNTIHPSAFNVTRAYINVTGNVSHNVSFRVTPDISRLTTTTTTTGLQTGESVSASTSLDGSLTFRLKYAYGQFNLDDQWSKGSWVRLGLQQTPYVDYAENIYRYRFQGPIFEDTEKFITSSDFALSTHYNFPGNFGDVHGGYYNGDGYAKADANDQKAIQIRATLRPAPNAGVIKGVRLTVFYDADDYAQGDAKTRLIENVTFEHKYINAGVDHLDAKDQTAATASEVKADGWSVWATPKSTKGWEGLLRYDSLKPDKTVDAKKSRKIAGVAYWFTTQKPATAALLLDYEDVKYDTLLAKPDEKRYALHALFAF
jgi:Phosphate-selective porin O and P